MLTSYLVTRIGGLLVAMILPVWMASRGRWVWALLLNLLLSAAFLILVLFDAYGLSIANSFNRGADAFDPETVLPRVAMAGLILIWTCFLLGLIIAGVREHLRPSEDRYPD